MAPHNVLYLSLSKPNASEDINTAITEDLIPINRSSTRRF